MNYRKTIDNFFYKESQSPVEIQNKKKES